MSVLYSTFIGQLRNQVGDQKRPVHIDWNGDAATTVFKIPTDCFPVYDGANSYTVKIGASVKTETTDYTLDKNAGVLTFLSAPASGTNNVTLDSSAVYLTDADWLNVMNNIILSLGDDFFKEFLDTTGFTATANMLSLSLVSAQPNCIAVYEFRRRSGSSVDWTKVENTTNWRYDRDNNIIYIGSRDAFTVASEPLSIRGLKTYTRGTATSDTIDVQDKFLTILEYGSIARYWKYRYKSVVELVSKMTQESSRTPLQELIMLSDRFDRLYETEKAKLRPMKPPRVIPTFRENGGIA